MRRRFPIALFGALAPVAVLALPLSAWGASDTGGPEDAVGAELEEWLPRPGLGLLSASSFNPNHRLGLQRSGSSSSTTLAHRRSRRRSTQPESYLILKGGGMYVAEESTNGVFLGFELGGAVEDVLDVGFSIDYFYRSTSQMDVLQETRFEELPVQVVATTEKTAAHLVPLGLTLRVRLPVGGDALSPFISGTLAYEALFLENIGDPDSDDPVLRALEQNETFTGFGWQAAAGLDIKLSPSLGLFGEVGMHRSSPKMEVEMDGVPVDLKVDLDGGFLRGGLRIAM
jgi:hypothetical protein